MLTCYMCGETKPEADFAFADMVKGIRQRHCRKCHAAYRRAHYLANRDEYIRREIARMARYRAENRVLLLAYLASHACVDCGETDPLVLDFDHRDPSLKRSEVGRLAIHKPWAIVMAEIAKCDVRCANCHRKRTAHQFAWGKLSRVARDRVLGAEDALPVSDNVELSLSGSMEPARRCCSCGQTRPADDFPMKDRRRGLRATKCLACQRAYSREHYRRNRHTYLTRAATRRKKDREDNRQRVFDYLAEHHCVDCGETDPIVLDFDHRDGATKRGSVSRLISQVSWAVLEREIAQCDVRCANCHRRRTAAKFSWSKMIRETA